MKVVIQMIRIEYCHSTNQDM